MASSSTRAVLSQARRVRPLLIVRCGEQAVNDFAEVGGYSVPMRRFFLRTLALLGNLIHASTSIWRTTEIVQITAGGAFMARECVWM